HVAVRAVGEARADDELLLARGIIQDARRRRHDQPNESGHASRVGPDTLGHPVAEDAVADAVLPHPLAALVGHPAGPLQEDQARLGLERVGAPGAALARQGLEVEGRIVAAQAEPEAVLARGSAMAGTLVAAGLGQRGQDLVGELNGSRRPGLANPDARLRLARSDPHENLSPTVATRLDP